MTKRQNRQRLAIFLLIALFLTGCAATEPSENPSGGSSDAKTASHRDESNIQEGMTAQPALSETVESGAGMHLQYVGDSLYYTVFTPNEDPAERTVAIYRKNAEEETLLLSLTGQDQERMDVMAADWEHNLYLFCYLTDQEAYHVKKLDGQLREVYDVKLSFQKDREDYLKYACVIENGEILAVSAMGRSVYLTADGTQKKTADTLWAQKNIFGEGCGLVSTADAFYSYYFEQGELHIDMLLENGSWKQGKTVKIPEDDTAVSKKQEGTGWYSVFGGEAFLLAAQDSLWRMEEPLSGEVYLCFSFQDENINVQGDQVRLAAQSGKGEFLLCLYDKEEKVRSLITVKQQELSDTEPRRKVVLGELRGYEYPKEMIRAYNSSQKKYQIVTQSYQSPAEFKLALVQGNGPDLINLNGMTVEELTEKEILEDMSGLMGEESCLPVEALLPSVRESCTVDGGIRFLFPDFAIQGMIMEKGIATDGGISMEAFLNMGKVGEGYLLNTSGSMSHEWVMSKLLNDMGAYVDWEQRTCRFDSVEFIDMLNGVRSLPEPPDEMIPIGDLSSAQALREQVYLADTAMIFNMVSYLNLLEAYSDHADITGLPTESGEAQYQMINNTPLGINSASKQKEGAFDFIAYTVNREEEEEDSGRSFSVLTERFEKYLYPEFEEEEHFNQYLNEIVPVRYPVTQEQADSLQYIVDHAVWKNPTANREIRSIVSEETAYFFAGDKTAEEVAGIIQSRVELFLNE